MPIKILQYKQGICLVLILFFLSLSGFDAYKGSFISYLFFDISWLMVLFSALCFSQTYIIFYIQIMLFLGFWLKLMAHLVLGVFFVEPTGYWKQGMVASSSWDQVLTVSGLAACGILFANYLFYYVTKNRADKINTPNVPLWYTKHNKFAWNSLIIVALAVNAFNVMYQMCITGLQPQTILPYHLNALIIGVMVIAIPLCMSTFLGWDNNLKQKQRFYWVCILAFITSISIASRAIYLFWTVPYILVVISHPQFSFKNISLWKNKKLVLTSLLLVLLTLTTVSLLRVHYYTATNLYQTEAIQDTQDEQERLQEQINAQSHFRAFDQIQKLFVGRWVGIEGVMATTAYKHAGWPFFINSMREKPYVGDIGVYTRVVLKPNKYHDTDKTMFSSLPGLVGILNYSNSAWVIFFGMTGCCLLLCYVELLSNLALRSKFLLSQQGLILGYWCVSGLNIPYLGMINLLECLCVTLFLSAISPVYNFFMKYPTRNSVLNAS